MRLLFFGLVLSIFHISGVSQSNKNKIRTYYEDFQGRTSDLNDAPWVMTGGEDPNDKTVQGTVMGTGTNTIVNDPSERGNRVMKIDKKVPPPNEYYNSESCREEIMYISKWKDVPGAPSDWPPWFTPITYRWRFYFTGNHDWDDDKNSPFTIGQWHHSKQVGAVSPPGTLRIKGNDLTFTARWTSSKNISSKTIKGSGYTLKKNLKKNTWYYIVMDITWDYREGKTGLIRAYLKEGGWPSKSNLVLDHSGKNKGVGYNYKLTGYAQVGGYMWAWRNANGADRSRAAGVKKFEFFIDDWEYTIGKHSFSSTANQSTANQSPNADAGKDQSTILHEKKTITLNGSGTDPDGTIVKYKWRQKSGPTTAAFKDEDTPNLKISNLKEGVYLIRLTVTDNDGAKDSDDVLVIVNAVANSNPVADAGADKTITLPTNKISLKGTATDLDGTIAKYRWSQKSGPNTAVFKDEDTPDLKISNLKEGAYVIRLTVTDNDGAKNRDDVLVTVNAVTNSNPVADAGADKTITLPTNKISLKGTATDLDGTIAKYKWSQKSGPTAAAFKDEDTPDLKISNLKEGVYVVKLKVTDDKGATDIDQVKVTVFAIPPSISADVTESTCSASDGAITLNLKGGKGPFTYKWSNGAKTKNLEDISSGDYQVTVTDNNGGSTAKSFNVSNKNSNLKIEASIKNATCSDNNGSIEVTASGGTGPYSFEWSSKARTASLNKLTGGSYSLVVKDQNGCSKKFSFKVSVDPEEVVHNVTSKVANASCTGNDGSISLAVSGNKGPYSFVWSHGATGATLNTLENGKYTVTIADKNGCYMSTEYTINQDPGPAKPTITQAGDSLYVAQQATNYQWFREDVAIEGANHRSLKYTEAGTYSVQISNNINCMTSSDYFYAKDPPPASIIGNQTFTMQQVDIYPNPAIEKINLRLYLNEPAATSITIYDFQGRVMLSRDLGVVNSQITENLRVDQYPSGMFLIRVKANQEIVTRRFLKH